MPILRVAGSAGAERGATLLEAALTLALFGSTIALANVILSAEAARQRDVLLGRDLRIMTEVSRSFVRDEYETLKQELAGLPDGFAMMEIGMPRLSNAGFLPATFLAEGERSNSYGQDYLLLVRGVDRQDTSRPAATLRVAEIDVDGDEIVDGKYTDEDPANGELDLEVILVTSGGGRIPAQHGNPAVAASGLPVAGFLAEADAARGAYGNWEMDISAYSSLDGYPEVGRFVSLIALSGFGVLDFAGETAANAGAGNPLERCPDAAGDLLDDCAANNEMYSGIVFNLAGGDNPVQTAAISNLYNLEMGLPVDSDADGTADVLSTITGAAGIACGSARPDDLLIGTLLLDCPETEFSGGVSVASMLAVEGETSLAGTVSAGADLSATGSVTASSFFAESIGGQNLAQGIYAAHLIALDAGTAIDKPDCGAGAGQPAVYALPVSFVSPDGEPLVGVQAFAEQPTDPDKWTVHMRAAIDRDRDGDGYADVIELDSGSNLVLALTKCE